MLNDEHFKVLEYNADSNTYFPNLSTPIKGGIAITVYDNNKKYGAIGVYTKYTELNSILRKVNNHNEFVSFSSIVYSRTEYRLTEKLHIDNPTFRYKEDTDGENIGRLSKGHDYDMSSNIFERLPEVFYDELPSDNNEYIQIIGRYANKRITKYIRRDYVNVVENLFYYKLFIPQANGSGTFGENVTVPIIEGPKVGHTETFLSIGKFETINEAEAAKKYICSKFLRTLLGVLKVTQNGNKPVWKLIPLQDFTASSDIDWSKSIHEIDLQLYRKYGLSVEEIEFIETNVREMA